MYIWIHSCLVKVVWVLTHMQMTLYKRLMMINTKYVFNDALNTFFVKIKLVFSSLGYYSVWLDCQNS